MEFEEKQEGLMSATWRKHEAKIQGLGSASEPWVSIFPVKWASKELPRVSLPHDKETETNR